MLQTQKRRVFGALFCWRVFFYFSRLGIIAIVHLFSHHPPHFDSILLHPPPRPPSSLRPTVETASKTSTSTRRQSNVPFCPVKAKNASFQRSHTSVPLKRRHPPPTHTQEQINRQLLRAYRPRPPNKLSASPLRRRYPNRYVAFLPVPDMCATIVQNAQIKGVEGNHGRCDTPLTRMTRRLIPRARTGHPRLYLTDY